MLLLVTAHSADGTELDGIQDRRDRSHIILAQKRSEQSRKMLSIPMCIPEHIIHLLKGPYQDIPQLIQDLSFPVIAGCRKPIGQLTQSFLQPDLFQETVQSLDLL